MRPNRAKSCALPGLGGADQDRHAQGPEGRSYSCLAAMAQPPGCDACLDITERNGHQGRTGVTIMTPARRLCEPLDSFVTGIGMSFELLLSRCSTHMVLLLHDMDLRLAKLFESFFPCLLLHLYHPNGLKKLMRYFLSLTLEVLYDKA